MFFKGTIIQVLIFFMLSGYSVAQSNSYIKGMVIDSRTNEPIAYANIGFTSIGKGTSTDEYGMYELRFPNNGDFDSLQVSAIGYFSAKISVLEALQTDTIRLKPRTYEFKDIRVSGRKSRTKWIGKKIRPIMPGAFGASGPGKTIGAAFAFKVEWRDRLPLRPLNARLYPSENLNDSLRIRCRFMNVDDSGEPGEDLIPLNYILTTDKKSGWVTCNFTDDLLLINEKQFYVVFEWLKMSNSKNVAPLFSKSIHMNVNPLVKRQPFGKWKEIDWANNLVYGLKVEY
jgi:hypothetical protein